MGALQARRRNGQGLQEGCSLQSGGRGWGPPGRGLSQWLRGLRVAQSGGWHWRKVEGGGSTTYLGRKIKCLMGSGKEGRGKRILDQDWE